MLQQSSDEAGHVADNPDQEEPLCVSEATLRKTCDRETVRRLELEAFPHLRLRV